MEYVVIFEILIFGIFELSQKEEEKKDDNEDEGVEMTTDFEGKLEDAPKQEKNEEVCSRLPAI